MKTKIRIWIYPLLVIGLIVILINGCKKSDQAKLPEVFTRGVRYVGIHSAFLVGEIKSNGGERLTEQGFCWSERHLPVITDNKIMMGFQDVCRYGTNVIGLSKLTDYNIRAYAINSIGTAYGEELTFTTKDVPIDTGTVADVEGNVYKTIGIGSQVWMAENLKTIRYSNGDLIGTTTPATLVISNGTSFNYQWAYDGNESNVATYGRLYTWYAVTDTRNVCPTGWHVPSNDDWSALITFLGGSDFAGGKLKEDGTTHWLAPNTLATNETGFTALPGGGRNNLGHFDDINTSAIWWSSTESYGDMAYPWYTSSNLGGAYSGNTYKVNGFSVRCIKDN